MSPTAMRWGSPGVSGELSLGSNASGGGKTKPESWPAGGGGPAKARGEKPRSEAEFRRVLEEDSTADTGVDKDMAKGEMMAGEEAELDGCGERY